MIQLMRISKIVILRETENRMLDLATEDKKKQEVSDQATINQVL